MKKLKTYFKSFFWSVKLFWKKTDVSRKANISTKAEIIANKQSGTLKIGDYSTLSDRCRVQVIDGGEISIGQYSFINKGCFIISRIGIKIGDRCTFGPNVMIYDHNHGIKKNQRNNYRCNKIEIGDDVWIGANVIILKGCKIGSGCVIGAGCVIKEDIPDNKIVTQKIEYEIQTIVGN